MIEDMSTWQYDLYSAYRKQQNNTTTKYFAEREMLVQSKYPFILKERDDWPQNIIVEEVARDIEEQKRLAEANKIAFPLHKYLHHGLSSQAMLFNLFGEPLLKRDYAFFQDVFQFPDIQIDARYELKFEHYNRNTFNENQQQPTSFDFAVFDSTGKHKNIFVEAKYVETEFGGCSAIEGGECDGLNPISDPNLCYLTHKGRTYWELMRKYELDRPYMDSPICPLSIYYQFYRELMFALENNGYFVMLIDRRNPAFEKHTPAGKRGLIPVLTAQVPAKYYCFIKVIYIQDVLPFLEKHGYTWVEEFSEKYGVS